MESKKLSRRGFIRRAAIISSAAAIAPSLLASVASAQGKPSAKPAPRRVAGAGGKVNLAVVGIGNRGADNLAEAVKTGLCDIVALCDVDLNGAHTARALAAHPGVPRFTDFRAMFDKMAPRIDAVMISTPDHSHFPISMLAMSLGKHVYVEKPLARTFNECQLMMEAEKKYGVVTQMGNQGHSEANYFQFKAWKEAGIIKDVTAVTAHMNNVRRWHEWNPAMSSYPAGEALPEGMDWDAWLATTHPHDYNRLYHNGDWRCWYDFGMGVLGDWGAHIVDTVHEFLDLGLPTEVDPLLLKGHNPFFYPFSTTLKFKFPARGEMPPLDITWHDGLDNIPPVPEGYGVSELDPNIPPVAGWQIQPAKLNPGKEIYSETLTFKGGSHGSTLSIIPEQKALDMALKLPEVAPSPSNHYANFLLACMDRERARSPFSLAAPLCQVFCLGVISQWTGSKVVFDREKRQITNNPLANQLLWGAAPRKGWEEFYKM